jgi:signal transduction histidine kinase
MRIDDLRSLSLFESLTEGQLQELLAVGSDIRISPGVELFREGELADHWWVLLSGAIQLLRHVGREDVIVATMDVPGRWAGGFRAWDEHGTYLATGRGAAEGRVLRISAEDLRDKSQSWFPFAGHLIEGLYRTARSIESTARQRESLVALGTLAAGFAHEINNPAAASTRAADALETACATLLHSLNRLARDEITSEQFLALDALRCAAEPVVAMAPLAMADREEALAAWLSEKGVARAWTLAPTLAAAGVDRDWCQRAETDLGSALEPGLEWVASTFAIASLLSQVKDSTRRVSQLVGAIRSYSQMDRASRQSIDVTEGLESTLIMLGHKLNDGVAVVRDYAPVPHIEAYSGELNQVWTNLIDNAVDAMNGVGILRVTTRHEGDVIVVEVADTGPGMPAEVAARAFEAFYTTKDVGKGTGLGLDIARRIIEERHGGTITIDSRPGETVLRVSLPVRPS